MALVSMVCPECKESIKIDDSKAFCFCLSCGAKIAIGHTVSVPNNNASSGTQLIADNYMKMAVSAKASGNNEQCELYCNKYLELNTGHALAWALKASASGWQSSIANQRLEEMVQYYHQAISLAATMEERNQILSMIKEDVSGVAQGICRLMCNNFATYACYETVDKLRMLHLSVLNSSLSLLQQSLCDVDVDAIVSAMGVMLNDAVVNVEYTEIDTYCSSNGGHPYDWQYDNFIDKMSIYLSAYECAAGMCENDYANLICIYDNMHNNYFSQLNARGWNNQGYGYYISRCLRNETIDRYNREMDQLKRSKSDANRRWDEHDEKVRAEWRTQYWNDHPEQKQELLTQVSGIQEEIDALKTRIQQEENSAQLVELKRELRNLELQHGNLSILKITQKMKLSKEIDLLKARLEKATHAASAESQQLLKNKQEKLAQLKKELNANHPEYADRVADKLYHRNGNAMVQNIRIKPLD